MRSKFSFNNHFVSTVSSRSFWRDILGGKVLCAHIAELQQRVLPGRRLIARRQIVRDGDAGGRQIDDRRVRLVPRQRFVRRRRDAHAQACMPLIEAANARGAAGATNVDTETRRCAGCRHLSQTTRLPR